MKLSEKQELVRLLNLYQSELAADNEVNIQEASKYPNEKWRGNYKVGIKAQYEHARIIATKLAVEIGKEIKSYWEL